MPTPSTPELERVQDIYNTIAPTWDQRQGFVERRLLGSAMRQGLANALRGQVLEIGTGTGVTLDHLWDSTTVTSFTGVDLSPGMLDQARAKTHNLPFPVTLQRMEAGHLDFPDALFDTVTISLTLCTVPDPAGTLREMARVCRPDGRIALLEHVRAPNPVIGWLQRALTPLQARMIGCHLDRPTDRIVQDMGFRIERHDTRLLDIFHLIVARPPVTGEAQEASPRETIAR